MIFVLCVADNCWHFGIKVVNLLLSINIMNLELKKYMKPKYSEIPRDLWKSFEYPMSFKNTKKLRICLYANPCGGNGDIVFSTKLYSYLKKW